MKNEWLALLNNNWELKLNEFANGNQLQALNRMLHKWMKSETKTKPNENILARQSERIKMSKIPSEFFICMFADDG